MINAKKLKIKEFKNLKDFEADLSSSVVLFKGENGLGKSTAIQFIEIALGKSTNIPPNATGSGEVVIDKNGAQYTFKVSFKDGKPIVTVTTEDGLKDNRKGTIAQIVGAMEFDIDEFVELSKSVSGRKKQVEIFKSFLPIDVRNDLAKYEADVKSKYDERTELGRDLKRIIGSIEKHSLFNERISELKSLQKIDVSSVFADLQKAQEHNKKIIEVQTRKNERVSQIESHIAEIKELEAKIEKLKETVIEKEGLNVSADKWLIENKLISTSDFENTLQIANTANAKYDNAQTLLSWVIEKENLEENIGHLGVDIELGREAISNAIKECSVIVDGLSFDDDMLLLNGIPVNPDSLSESEIMELGLKIKHAENSDSPLFIQRTESIGKKRWSSILAYAKERGLQIIGEEVIRGQEVLTVELSN